MDGTIKVLGLCGSLRKSSYNRMALRAASELLPDGMTLDAFEGLRDIPPYDDDVRLKAFPPPTRALREAIAACDALLIVSPEYNYGVPGMLKNAIDWASRPPDQPFDGKPIALMGVSTGLFGTARAQHHLRQSFVFLNGLVMPRPEVMIPQAAGKFDAEGRLTDEPSRKFIADFLVAFADWTRRVRR